MSKLVLFFCINLLIYSPAAIQLAYVSFLRVVV
jgi:hypothetical protein